MKLFRALSLITLSILCSINATASQVGVIAGLHGHVFIERNGIEIPSVSGAAILIGDHVRTRHDQIFQLILLDETVFTFAGDVDISLDVYEYDKTTHIGRLQITQYAGLMKFSTGHIANGQAGAFQIKQPNTDIAVLGTTGVVGMLSSEQAATYFPQIKLPATTEPVSYAALMGPGPRAARWVKSGAFRYTSDQGTVDLTKPGGSVLAVKGSTPVVFVAPALDISQAVSYDSDKDDNDGKNSSGSSSTAQNNQAMEFGNLSDTLPSVTNKGSANSDTHLGGDSINGALLRDIRNLLNNESMNSVIQRLEQTEGIPDQINPEIDPAPINQIPIKPIDLAPIEPIKPIDLEPIKPIELEPIKPIDRAPIKPIDLAPIEPIDLEPIKPIELDPIAPIELAPLEPIN
ncbi:hypothetical protein [Thalassolituus sp.]|uniref:hypothetical protein n=1 Tax=Thalassolituus sp. TaxID=2030822 RepID=UPI002A7F55A6|nr:hypothetical protein [Thalassolituus sp.]